MTEIPNFRTVTRGYDKDDVDQYIADLAKRADSSTASISETQAEAESLRQELATRYEQLEQLSRQLEAQQAVTDKSDTYLTLTDLGERVNRMFANLDGEVQQILAQANAEAARITSESSAAAEQMLSQADDYAQQTKSRVDNEAAQLIAEAQQKANDILDLADRESTARRDEAEVIFEQQRAHAAQIAAEFEQTLADRRSRATAEFATQMQQHQDAIKAAEDRRAQIESEADQYRDDIKNQADEALAQANAQANEIMKQARAAAERVRRESERELAATEARRDAITQQLTNIRQMLTTVGGAAMLNQLGGANVSLDETTEPVLGRE